MRNIIVVLIISLAALVPLPADAQDFTFQRIAWRSSAERVSQLMFALGYRQSEVTNDGDIWFSGPEDERVLAQISPRGLFRIAVLREVPETSLQSRMHFLTDSLTSHYGPADSVDMTKAIWVTSEGSLRIHHDQYASAGFQRIVIAHVSPTARSEMTQRLQYLADRIEEERRLWATSRVDQSRWRFIYAEDSIAVSYDVSRVSRPSADVMRVWLRWDNREPKPIRNSPSIRYAHYIEQRETRCSSYTWRIGDQHFYLGSQNVQSIRSEWTDWIEPVPESVGEAVLQELCNELVRRR